MAALFSQDSLSDVFFFVESVFFTGVLDVKLSCWLAISECFKDSS